MKIAIVVPKSANPKQIYKEYPLGAGYIGTILKHYDHQVRLIDQNIELSDNLDLVQEILRYEPDLIGFSILTPSYPTTQVIIQLLQSMGSRAQLIAGGIHPTIFPHDCLHDGFHYVIKGEGEEAIVKIVEAMEGKGTLSDIPNIAFKKNGVIVDTHAAQVNLDLNRLPIVDRSLFKIEKYTNHSISGTRGCPFSCKFCCNYNTLTKMSQKSRIRSVQSIIEEIEYIVKEYNAKNIFFTDDVFFTHKKTLEEFCKEIKKRNISIRYNAQLRINMVSEVVCQMLKESGCVKIEVGIESGSQVILDTSCKGISIQDIKKGIQIAKDCGLRIKTNWIYGLPGNMEEQYKSIQLMIETMPNEISIHQLIPFPGTDYYNERDKYGIDIREPKNFESFCYGELDDNIYYSYMSKIEYIRLVHDTITALEEHGYVSSDRATHTSEFVYTTPFDKSSLSPTNYEECDIKERLA